MLLQMGVLTVGHYEDLPDEWGEDVYGIDAPENFSEIAIPCGCSHVSMLVLSFPGKILTAFCRQYRIISVHPRDHYVDYFAGHSEP